MKKPQQETNFKDDTHKHTDTFTKPRNRRCKPTQMELHGDNKTTLRKQKKKNEEFDQQNLKKFFLVGEKRETRNEITPLRTK